MEKFKELIKDLGLDEAVFTAEVVEKLAVVMEAQLSEAKTELETKITDELKEQHDAEVDEYKSFMLEQLDGYLNEWTTEFVNSNEEQIEESVKDQTSEKILTIFGDIMEEFNMSVNSESIDSSVELDSLKESHNTAINENIALKKEMEDIKVGSLIESFSTGFDVESKKEKFLSMAEGLAYDGEDTFKEKLTSLAETVKGFVAKETSEDSTLDESETTENQDKVITEDAAPVETSENASILNYLQ